MIIKDSSEAHLFFQVPFSDTYIGNMDFKNW